jgi:hypothetical protein
MSGISRSWDPTTAAKCVVVAWSDTSVASDWVRDEAEKGKAANKLIPIFLDTVEQPLGFRQLHALNFVGWNYKPDHPSAGQLIAEAQGRRTIPPEHSLAFLINRPCRGSDANDF